MAKRHGRKYLEAVQKVEAALSANGDGGLDLVVTTVSNRARIYRNVAGRRGHWLLVRAIDPALGGRDVYGAEVIVHASGRDMYGWINPAYSFLCSNDPRAHFGLGELTKVEGIEVMWPGGKRERFPGTAADRIVVLEKAKGQ